MSAAPEPGASRRIDAGQLVFIAGIVLAAIAAGLLFLRLTTSSPAAPVGSVHHTLDSPYIARPFHRGQLHVSSSRSIGHSIPRDIARLYQRDGYEWISITDLNTLTPTNDYSTPGMVTSAGTLAQYSFGAFLAYGVDVIRPAVTPQGAVDAIRGQAAVTFLASPLVPPAPPYDQIAALRGLAGIEVYNARLARDIPTAGDASALWDQLLSSGHRLWGVAGDDSLFDVGANATTGRTSVDVQVVDLTAPLINDALSRGAFIASTGVRVLGVSTADGAITVITTDADEVTFIGKGGQTLATTKGSQGVYHVKWNEGYVRAVATRTSDGARAWVQPIFVNP